MPDARNKVATNIEPRLLVEREGTDVKLFVNVRNYGVDSRKIAA